MIVALILAAASATTSPSLVLEPGGLGLSGGTHVRFGLAQPAAVAAIASVLGKPVKQGVYPDCGQGIPLGHVHFRGGLEVSFIRHRFAGWTLDQGGEARWRSARGIGLGSTAAAVRAADPDVSIDDFNDSIVFASEKGVSGFLSGKGAGAKVIEVHAGETCIVD